MKHLNPRQGITTHTDAAQVAATAALLRVKHLNPRQGITTYRSVFSNSRSRTNWCETPKSPPGDYNKKRNGLGKWLICCTSVKHLNPRQGITTYVAALSERLRGVQVV